MTVELAFETSAQSTALDYSPGVDPDSSYVPHHCRHLWTKSPGQPASQSAQKVGTVPITYQNVSKLICIQLSRSKFERNRASH